LYVDGGLSEEVEIAGLSFLSVIEFVGAGLGHLINNSSKLARINRSLILPESFPNFSRSTMHQISSVSVVQFLAIAIGVLCGQKSK
jgi:hypothetical protein